ncbi:MAG: Ig-like domain-containing protein [Limisphaerales bacterium]
METGTARLRLWAVFVAMVFAGWLVSGSGDARAEVTATYLVGLPTIADGKARYPLSVRYSATAGERVAFLGIDVTGSDGRLTSNGTDFTGFSFDADATALTGWSAIPGTGFGVGASRSSIEFETPSVYVAPGTTLIGALVVDLRGLTPGPDERLLRLDGADSVIGAEIPGTPGSFQFVQPGVEYVSANAAPVANVEQVRLRRGESVSVLASGSASVLANDTDPDGDALTAILVDSPRSGALTLNADGSFRYTHDGGGDFLDRFTYKASDGKLESSEVAVFISIVQSAVADEGRGFPLSLVSDEERFGVIRTWNIRWGDGTELTMDSGPATVNHEYLDGPGILEIEARAFDDSGTLLFTTFARVEVSDVAPTIELQGEGTAAEGGAYELTLGASMDPGQDTITEWIVDWGDGVRETHTSPGGKVHVYADGPATRAIVVDLRDEDGLHAAAGQKQVNVVDVHPAVTLAALGGSKEIAEGAPFALEMAVGDPGTDTILSWIINWGDGTIETIPGDPGATVHTYRDGPANVTITATVTDEDGTHSGTSPLAIQVLDVPPTIELLGEPSVAEGSPYRLTLGRITDPGRDTVTEWDVDWGDGVREVFTASGDKTHVYTQGGVSRMIVVDLRDEDGSHVSAGRLGVLVTERTAQPSIEGPGTVLEGAAYVLNLMAADRSGIRQWVVDWGDGQSETVGGAALLVEHTFSDGPASHTIRARVELEDTSIEVGASIDVNVMNIAPTLNLSGASETDEGVPYTLNLLSNDPGADVITEWTIDWGDGNTETAPGHPASVTHVFGEGPNSYVIRAEAKDEDGTYPAGNTISIAVRDVPPTLTLSGATRVNEGSPYTLALAAAGLGTDTLSAWTIAWGDGVVDTVPGTATSATHVYPDGPANPTITASARVEGRTYEAGQAISVGVLNVAPRIPLSGSRSVDEGAPYRLTVGPVVDPGQDQVTEYVIHWGDGSQDTFSSPGEATHVYPDGPSNQTITIDLLDEDGRHFDADLNAGSGDVFPRRIDGQWQLEWDGKGILQWAAAIDGPFRDVGGAVSPYPLTEVSTPSFFRVLRSHAVQVVDVPPRIVLEGDRTVSEGSPYVLTLGRIFDPGQDTVHEYVVHWGDGSENAYLSGGEVSHVYADGPADRTITVDLVDEDGVHLDADIKAGADVLTARIEENLFLLNWQGGGTLQAATQVEQWFQDVEDAASPYTPSAPPEYQFFRLLRSHPVHVTDVAPTIELSGAREIDEGGTYTLTLGAVRDPGNDTVSEYRVHWGDESEDRYAQGGPVTHIYADGPADRTVTVDLVDEDGLHSDADVHAGTTRLVVQRVVGGLNFEWDPGSVLQAASELGASFEDFQWAPNSYLADGLGSHGFYRVLRSHAVRVNDVAPTIRLDGEREAVRGAPYVLTLGEVADPGTDTVTGYWVHWGDGSEDFYVHAGTVTHVYSAASVEHTIIVDLVDEDGVHADAGLLFGNPELTIRRSQDGLVLEWGDGGTLQAAAEAGRLFADLPGARSPYSVNPADASAMYRVLRSLTVLVIEGGAGPRQASGGR